MSNLMNIAFAIFNGLAPVDDAGTPNPRVMPLPLDFTGGVTSRKVDLFKEEAAKQLGFVQAIFIDNSLSAQIFRIVFDITGLPLQIPANSQGLLPVFSPDQTSFTATSTSGLIIPIFLLNVPQAVAVWKAI